MNKIICSDSSCKSRGDEAMVHIDVQPAAGTGQAIGLNDQTNATTSGDAIRISQSPNNKGIRILQIYFRFMYYIFISTYDGKEVVKTIAAKIFHSVVFAAFCLLSVLYSAEEIKDRIIGQLEPGEIFNYITLGYAILNGIVRLMFFYVVVFKHDEIFELLSLFTRAEMINKRSIRIAKALPYIMAIGTMLYGVGNSVFNIVEFSEWYPQNVVLARAWQVEHLRRLKNVTLGNVSLGIFGICTELLSSIHQYASLSVLLICSVSMYFATTNLDVPLTDDGVIDALDTERKAKVRGKEARKKQKQAKKISKREDKQKAQVIWKQYTHLRRLSKMLERTFGTLLRWTHIYYLLLVGNFLKTNLDGKNKNFDFVLDCFRVMMVVLTYHFAIKSSRKNKAFREWVLSKYKDKGFVVIGCERVDRNVVLEDTANHPIGIGSDIFYVDEAFVFKLLSVVASYFLFIADRDKSARKEAE